MTSDAHPVELLEREHQTILAFLDALDAEAARLRTGADVRVTFWRDALEFARSFVDGAHVKKEEELLFGAMVDAGFPATPGPIAAMVAEHDDAHALRRELESAFATRDGLGVGRLARSYAAFLRDHIARENHVLFPLARRVLPERAAGALKAAIEDFDRATAEGREPESARRICTAAGVRFDLVRDPPFDDR
jgi:hemerythrin-like domain-containing protein